MTILGLYLSSFITTILMLVYMGQILENKLNIYTIVLISGVLSIQNIFKAWLTTNDLFFSISAFVGFIGFLLIPVFFYKGKLWKRFIVVVYFMILLALCDLTAVGIKSVYVGISEVTNMSTIVSVLSVSIFTALFAVMGKFSVCVWKMIKMKYYRRFYLVFLLLLLGQGMVIVYSIYINKLSVWLKASLVCIVADLLIFIYNIYQLKRIELKKELEKTHYLMRIEQDYYLKIENKRDELAKIRHDFNNQLSSIRYLAQVGEIETAKEMLNSLSERVKETNEI